MKKIIFVLTISLIALCTQSQTWRQSDGKLRTLNADLSLANTIPSDLIYKINGSEFKTPIPVSPKLYRNDKILGVRLVGNRLVVKYTGYVKRGEWIGRIVWKKVYNVQNGAVRLQGIVDGNYVPPKSIDEVVTFQDE